MLRARDEASGIADSKETSAHLGCEELQAGCGGRGHSPEFQADDSEIRCAQDGEELACAEDHLRI